MLFTAIHSETVGEMPRFGDDGDRLPQGSLLLALNIVEFKSDGGVIAFRASAGADADYPATQPRVGGSQQRAADPGAVDASGGSGAAAVGGTWGTSSSATAVAAASGGLGGAAGSLLSQGPKRLMGFLSFQG